MHIGIPKEIKNREFRVSLTPSGVHELVTHGHNVTVETHAGAAIGFLDEHYSAAGATIAKTAKDVFQSADMIVKVKEPQPQECALMRSGQIIFSYLHLAPNPELTQQLIDSDSIAIAYETVTASDNSFPLLAPMSEVAGRVAVQAGIHCLEKSQGGQGVLLSGVPGVEPGKVTIIGGGVVGTNAAQIAVGMGADVTILERSLPRMRELELAFMGTKLKTIYATADTVAQYVAQANLLIGAVLIPGAKAPKLVSREMVQSMKTGSVIVDVAVDQGGCVETIMPTTHENPTYVEEGVIHYGVTNMPAAVAYTSTRALENATLSSVVTLANLGAKEALRHDPHLLNGLNIYHGKVTYKAVADDLNYNYVPASDALEM